jgi:hypothetical protein
MKTNGWKNSDLGQIRTRELLLLDPYMLLLLFIILCFFLFFVSFCFIPCGIANNSFKTLRVRRL